MEEGSLCLKCAATQVTNTRIKAKNRVTSLYFSSGKGLVTYGTPLCPSFHKSRYSAYYGCSKNCFVSFLLYIDLVSCFFAPEKQFAVRDAEMLTANLAVRLLLAPVTGHNPVNHSCIFYALKLDPLLYRNRFFAGLIPGDDSRFAIFVGFIKLYSRLDYLYLYYSVYIQALN